LRADEAEKSACRQLLGSAVARDRRGIMVQIAATPARHHGWIAHYRWRNQNRGPSSRRSLGGPPMGAPSRG
jgi:hypothetical protein